MNKKILVVSILAIFTLVAISFTSVVSSNNIKTNEKKESPIYRIRIISRIVDIIDNIITRFVGQRVFWLPFSLLRNAYNNRGNNYPPSLKYDTADCPTCNYPKCR